jgi:hypothetical protein
MCLDLYLRKYSFDSQNLEISKWLFRFVQGTVLVCYVCSIFLELIQGASWTSVHQPGSMYFQILSHSFIAYALFGVSNSGKFPLSSILVHDVLLSAFRDPLTTV